MYQEKVPKFLPIPGYVWDGDGKSPNEKRMEKRLEKKLEKKEEKKKMKKR